MLNCSRPTLKTVSILPPLENRKKIPMHRYDAPSSSDLSMWILWIFWVDFLSGFLRGRYIHSAFQSCYRLDHAERHRGQGQGHEMNLFVLLPGEIDSTDDSGVALLLHTNSQIQETTRPLNCLAKQVDRSYGTERHQQSTDWKWRSPDKFIPERNFWLRTFNNLAVIFNL